MEWNDAFALLQQYVQSESLIKHALAVDAAMVGYARKWNEDEERWSNAGLLHDLDYEMAPDQHPVKGSEMLRNMGFDEELVHAVLAHGDATGTPRETLLDRTLYAVDEMAGFVVACVLVRPSKNFDDLTVKSVKKKFKDKAFAKAVDRNQAQRAAEELGVELEDHFRDMIQFLKERETFLQEKGLSLIE